MHILYNLFQYKNAVIINYMKSLLIPIVGVPNVGKSTLLNSLFGQKVTIVTRKPHTTRNMIYISQKFDDSEIVFIDTPGIEKVKGKLGTTIFDSMKSYVQEIDSMLLILDATNPQIEKFESYVSKSIVVLNKIDYLRKPKLLPIIAKLIELNAVEIFCICAKTGDGVAELRNYLIEKSKIAIEYNEEGSMLEEDIKFFACECLREKLLTELNQEIPYQLFITCENIKIPKESAWEISLNIVVPKKSYKPIIIGKKGSFLKKIGTSVRLELNAKLMQSGFLKLNVVVDEKLWQRTETYKLMGWQV